MRKTLNFRVRDKHKIVHDGKSTIIKLDLNSRSDYRFSVSSGGCSQTFEGSNIKKLEKELSGYLKGQYLIKVCGV